MKLLYFAARNGVGTLQTYAAGSPQSVASVHHLGGPKGGYGRSNTVSPAFGSRALLLPYPRPSIHLHLLDINQSIATPGVAISPERSRRPMYIGPETLMPLASVVAAVAGVAMMFWRRVVAFFKSGWSRAVRIFAK